MHLTDRIKCALGGVGTCPLPRRIVDFRPSEIVFAAVLGVKQQELDDQLPNLVRAPNEKIEGAPISNLFY